MVSARAAALTLALACAAVVLAPAAGLAQGAQPIGRFVVDLRGSSSGLPTAVGWTPTLPATTPVPGRGLGIEAAGHVYVLRVGAITLGVGTSWLLARGSQSPPQAEGDDSAVATTTVSTRVSSLAPQLSLNFGHALGWSYLSAGLGVASIHSQIDSASPNVIALTRESGQVKSLNFGGGARWFVTDHVGVGFDVRWHKLSIVGATAIHPGAPRASLLAAGVGVTLK